MVDLRYLQDFLDIANTGRFSASAHNRCISQPALTRRIQQLEDWVGAQLFDRSATPLRLTLAGEAFRPLAARIVDELDAFRRRTAQRRNQPLRCMSLHTVGPAFLHWLDHDADGRRHGASTIAFGTYLQCFAALREDATDIAVVYYCEQLSDAGFKGLCRQRIGTETFIPVAAAEYAQTLERLPHATDAVPALVELARDNYLGRALAPTFDHCKRQLGCVAGPIGTRIDAMRSLIDSGCGIGWLPASMVHAQIHAGTLRSLAERLPSVIFDVVLIATSEERLARAAPLSSTAAASAPQRSGAAACGL